MLHSELLKSDPRVRTGKGIVARRVARAFQRITEVRGPRPELQKSYAEMLSRLAVARGGAPYFPYITSGLGNGPFVELADGSVKLDFIVGIGVHGLGHSHCHVSIDCGCVVG